MVETGRMTVGGKCRWSTGLQGREERYWRTWYEVTGAVWIIVAYYLLCSRQHNENDEYLFQMRPSDHSSPF